MWAVFLLPCHDSVLSGTLVGLFLVSGPFLYTGPGLSLASWEFLRAAEGPGRLRWSSAELIQLTGCSFSRETVKRRLEVTTEGLGLWRIPSPPPPYRHHINPYEKMFIIHVQSLPQHDRTVPPGGHIEQRISSLAHMFKFLFHIFNFHSVDLFHIALTFFLHIHFSIFSAFIRFFLHIFKFLFHMFIFHSTYLKFGFYITSQIWMYIFIFHIFSVFLKIFVIFVYIQGFLYILIFHSKY